MWYITSTCNSGENMFVLKSNWEFSFMWTYFFGDRAGIWHFWEIFQSITSSYSGEHMSLVIFIHIYPSNIFSTLCPSPICAWGSKSVYSHCSFFSHLSLYPSFPYAICPGLQICLHSSVFSSLHAWRNIPNGYPFLSLISFCVLLKQRERETHAHTWFMSKGHKQCLSHTTMCSWRAEYGHIHMQIEQHQTACGQVAESSWQACLWGK